MPNDIAEMAGTMEEQTNRFLALVQDEPDEDADDFDPSALSPDNFNSRLDAMQAKAALVLASERFFCARIGSMDDMSEEEYLIDGLSELREAFEAMDSELLEAMNNAANLDTPIQENAQEARNLVG